MKNVMYFAPAGVEEVLNLLAEHGENATILAGGTDLVPKINYYDLKPEVLIYVGGLALDYLKEEDGNLTISALTTTEMLATSALIDEKASALSEAARQSGSTPIRNTATIGGNLANASPAADLATPLLVMDAELALASVKGKRAVDIKDFFVGPGQTVLKPEELITEIYIPAFDGKTIFLKIGRRRAMTLSVVNVAVRLDMENGKCNDARIAFGSMAPTPMRCIKSEALLKGNAINKSLINKCAAEAIAETSPIDDQRATAWYRKKAGENLVGRALVLASGIEDL